MRDNLLHRVVVYFVNISDCWQNKWQFIVWMMLVANIPYCLIGVFFSISAYPHCLFLKQQTIYIVLNVDTVFQTLKISTRNLKSTSSLLFWEKPCWNHVVWSTKFKNCYNLWHLFMYTNSKYLLLQLS